MTQPNPTPPLPPPQLEVRRTERSRSTLVDVILAILLGAGVMSLVWLDARSDVQDAKIERDSAIAERNAATDAKLAADAQLRIAQDDLAASRDALETASTETDELDTSAQQEVEALRDEVNELSEEVERLEGDNETLAADLADAEDAVADTGSAPAESTPDPVATSTTVTVSAADVGGRIAGLFRPSVLGPGQKTCVGESVLDGLGEERVLAAIAADSPGDDEEFVETIENAAAFCGIDPSAIFG